MPQVFRKTCLTCQRDLLATSFYVSSNWYLSSHCRACTIARVRRHQATPEGKEAHAAAMLRYLASDRGKATRKAYQQSEVSKERRRRYWGSERGKAIKAAHGRRRRARADYKEKRRAYEQSERGRAAVLRSQQSDARRMSWRQYKERNQERVRAMIRAYFKTPKGREAYRRGAAKRRAILVGQRAIVATLTAAEWQDILTAHNHSCRYCGRTDRPLTQDHVIPLKVGGLHVKENVVPACGPCNSRKGARLLPPGEISLTTG